MATIPDKPRTDVEQYLNRIATGEGEIPAKPNTNVEQYLAAIVENGTGGGSEGRVVDELPETGETGYIYLVLKEESKKGDIYDEYMWALQQDGETYGWEHIGATNEVTIKLYDGVGDNTDGAMTQKAATEMLYYDYAANDKRHVRIGYLGYQRSGSIAIGSTAVTSSENYGVAIGNAIATGASAIGISHCKGIVVPTAATAKEAIAIGSNVEVSGEESVGIGCRTTIRHEASIALGSQSVTGRPRELSLGGNSLWGYCSRYIANVKAGELDTDAVNKKQMEDAIASAGATVLTNTEFNNLWENA